MLNNKTLKIDYHATRLYTDVVTELYIQLNELFVQHIKLHKLHICNNITDLKNKELEININYCVYDSLENNDIKINYTGNVSTVKLYDDMNIIYKQFISTHATDIEECSPLHQLYVYAYIDWDDNTFEPVFDLVATFTLPSDVTKTLNIRPIKVRNKWALRLN